MTPFLFAVNGYANTVPEKVNTSFPIKYSGKLGLAYLNVAEHGAFDVTDTFRPELTVFSSPSFNLTPDTKIDQIWLVGFKIAGHTAGSHAYTFDSFKTSTLASQKVSLNQVGIKTRSKYGKVDVGLFGTRTSKILNNNFSMVSVAPTNFSSDINNFSPYKQKDSSRSKYVMSVTSMIGDWSGQGSSFHLGYTTPPLKGTQLSVAYVPMNSSDGSYGLLAKNDSMGYTVFHRGSLMGVKYDARAGYTTKTRPVSTTAPVNLSFVDRNSQTSTITTADNRTYHTDQTSLSIAAEKAGMTMSVSFADHKWKHVPIEYYRKLQESSLYQNSSYTGSTSLNTTTRLKNPKFYDFSIGYQKPMLGGYAAVKLGHTISSNWATGRNIEINDTSSGFAQKLVQRNRTNVTGIGLAHHLRSLSTGLFINHYRNHNLYQDRGTADRKSVV